MIFGRPRIAPVRCDHTPERPTSGNNTIANTTYTPTREGSLRTRCCTRPVASNTASTSSNGTTDVNSPRCPAANTPGATCMVRSTATMADSDTTRPPNNGFP